VTALLDRLERFYDAVPRVTSRVEDVGPFTLFVSTGEWPYYARPRLGFAGTIAPGDVAAIRARQRERGVPETFEWVLETTPSLSAALEAAGLAVEEVPLLVLRERRPAALPTGYRVRKVEADDPELARALAVASVAFAHGGTAGGDAGIAERDREAAADTRPHSSIRRRMADGSSVLYVVEGDDGPVASGMYQAVGGVAEVVGVATLPAARRRGLGAAVTSALIDDAVRSGVDTVFLSAASDDVARVYERLGFERVGHAGLAEQAGGKAHGGGSATPSSL
jgi:ribosomal protein S18 acetylase RimI-like enzyme